MVVDTHSASDGVIDNGRTDEMADNADADGMAVDAHAGDTDADLANVRKVTIATYEEPDEALIQTLTFKVERETMQGPLIRLVSASELNSHYRL